MTNNSSSRLVSLADAARLAGFTPATIRRHVRLGRIRGAVKILGAWRLPVDEVERLLTGELDRRERAAERFGKPR